MVMTHHYDDDFGMILNSAFIQFPPYSSPPPAISCVHFAVLHFPVAFTETAGGHSEGVQTTRHVETIKWNMVQQRSYGNVYSLWEERVSFFI